MDLALNPTLFLIHPVYSAKEILSTQTMKVSVLTAMGLLLQMMLKLLAVSRIEFQILGLQ